MLKAGAKATDKNVLGLVTQKQEAESLLSRLKDIAEERNKPVAPLAMPGMAGGGLSISAPSFDMKGMLEAQAQAGLMRAALDGLSMGAITASEAMEKIGATAQTSTSIAGMAIQGFASLLSGTLGSQEEGMKMFGKSMEGAVQMVSNSMVAAAANGASSMAELAAGMKQATLSIVSQFIQQGVAAVVSGTMQKAKMVGPFAIPLAAAAGAIASTMFRGLISKIAPPKLAKGGLAFGPTMAVVGDNVGARSNPEVIAPLDKLQSMLGGSMGGDGFIASTRLDGRDLLIVLERAQKDKFRIT